MFHPQFPAFHGYERLVYPRPERNWKEKSWNCEIKKKGINNKIHAFEHGFKKKKLK